MVRVKFASENDEINGFYILATQSRLRGLPDGVYEINRAAVALLDGNSVRYTQLPNSQNAADESQAIRNPSLPMGATKPALQNQVP